MEHVKSMLHFYTAIQRIRTTAREGYPAKEIEA